MATTKLTVRHKDSTGKKTNTEIFNCDPDKINVNISSDTATAIDTFARNLTAMSTDTYEDAIITQTASIIEILND